MKLVSLRCPNCNANLEVNSELNTITCAYCGSNIYIDQEIKKQEIKIHGTVKVDGIKGVSDKIRIAKQYFKMENYLQAQFIAKEIIDEDPFHSDALIMWIKTAIILENYFDEDIKNKIEYLKNSDEENKLEKEIKELEERLLIKNLNNFLINEFKPSLIEEAKNKLGKDYRDIYNYEDKKDLKRTFEEILEIYEEILNEHLNKVAEKQDKIVSKIMLVFLIGLIIYVIVMLIIGLVRQSKYNDNIELEGKLGSGVKMYSIGDQEFYEIDSNKEYTTLLSFYNLYVGTSCEYDDKEYTWYCDELTDETGIQNDKSLAYEPSAKKIYGAVPSYDKDVFDNYLKEYEKYLYETYDVESEVRLITTKELKKFDCDLKEKTCNQFPINKTSYYTNYNEKNKYCVFINGSIKKYDEQTSYVCGIRPVIVVKTEILPQ